MSDDDDTPENMVYLSVQELTAVFGVTDNTIRSWIKSGIFGDAYEKVGNMYFVERTEVARVVREKYENNTNERE